MIAHTADTLTYCNGDGSKSLESWNEMMQYLDSWASVVPPSFRPFYEEASESENGKLFPQLLFANDCHGKLLFLIAERRLITRKLQDINICRFLESSS